MYKVTSAKLAPSVEFSFVVNLDLWGMADNVKNAYLAKIITEIFVR